MSLSTWMQLSLLVSLTLCATTQKLDNSAVGYQRTAYSTNRAIRGVHLLSSAVGVRSRIECATKCVSHCDCQGFNYNKNTQDCELVDTNHGIDSRFLLPAAGYTHYWPVTVPRIEWPVNCDQYTANSSNEYPPKVRYIRSLAFTSMSECRGQCTMRTECGGYAHYYTAPDRSYCRVFNINDQITSAYFNVLWHQNNNNYVSYSWFSKTCPYNLGDTDLDCDTYHQNQDYDNMMFTDDFDWEITRTRYIWQMTAEDCQRMCMLYTGCKSVTHIIHLAGGSGECTLYKTTLRRLQQCSQLANVNTDDYASASYERSCQIGEPLG